MAKDEAPKKNLTQTSLMPDITPEVETLEKGLTGSQLAKRFGVNQSTINRAWQPDGKPPRPEYFAQWSREYRKTPRGEKRADPDGLAWVKRGDRFYPIP